MYLKREVVEKLIHGDGANRRFTQDSPVLPEVWIQYGLAPLKPMKLLLTPHRRSSAGRLSALVRDQLDDDRKALPKRPGGRRRRKIPILYTRSHVATELYFDELVRVLLPMTRWWHEYVWKTTREHLLGDRAGSDDEVAIHSLFSEGVRKAVTKALDSYQAGSSGGAAQGGLPLPHDLLWMIRIVGTLAWLQQKSAAETSKRAIDPPSNRQAVDAIADLMQNLVRPDEDERQVLWQVNRNRDLELAIKKSRLAVKADAAKQVFELDHSKVSWAIIDSGIDATHPAFLRPGEEPPIARSRVAASYDFSRLRPLLDPDNLAPPYRNLPKALRDLMKRDDERATRWQEDLEQLQNHLRRGRDIDWGLLAPFLEIPHDGTYQPPSNDHGTHVAGILGADWRDGDQVVMQGICPDIGLYDLRVLDAKGRGDELGVLAALQFVQHLNGQKDYLAIHGANLSLSLRHEVANYACGRTPVCEECERLVATGVVVVAAAGNVGYLKYRTDAGTVEGYQSSSITDPGNAEAVITVGATHRYRPHTYGVSFFSSRGPTGDGRIKPDLVAPGEKVTAPTPGEAYARKDGTSMAAPHVSGAAAALMARHKELVGRPRRIKQVLCDTATDLQRERYFQGAGMLDILRALQSI